jgi:hypothetical protein
MNEQPTLRELQNAVDDFFQFDTHDRMYRITLSKLIQLRKEKTSWVGKDENNFRFRIDSLLDKAAPDWNLGNKIDFHRSLNY